jgi:hypothetical protein
MALKEKKGNNLFFLLISSSILLLQLVNIFTDKQNGSKILSRSKHPM